MSLARTLMNGVTESSVIDTTGFEVTNVSTESYFLDAACESLFTDIINVDKAYHIADIMGEVKVVSEGANGEAILEGIVKDTADKLKKAFQKFWAKLKEWFAQIKKLFNSLFLDNQKFVKEFRKELVVKKTKGFKYTGYHFTISAGDGKVDTVMGKIWDKIDTYSNGISTLSKAKGSDEVNTEVGKIITASNKTDVSKDSTDIQEDVIKSCNISGATTMSELNEELFQIYRNGEDKTEVIEEFEAESVSDMIEVLENKKYVSDVEKTEKEFEKQINTIIKALDGFKSTSTDTATKNEALKYAQKLSSYTTALLTLGKNAMNVKISAYRDAQKQYRSVLGAFVRFKPAKEGAEPEENETPTTESMLDMAFRML